jgi:DNA-directed RNA polymerase specialized sigma24 family protein
MHEDDDEIERRLRAAQVKVRAIDGARVERQEAVMAAVKADWSKYKIAQVLEVSAATVTSIIATAEKAES